MWSGLESWRRHHMWVEFVVGSLPCFERIFSRYPRFPLSSRSNTSKFQFDWSGTHGRVSTSCHELLSALWVPNYNLQLQLQFAGSRAEYFSSPFRPRSLSFSENLVMTLPPPDPRRGIGQPLCYRTKASSALPLPSATGQPVMRQRRIHNPEGIRKGH